jgi:hypothetical protein
MTADDMGSAVATEAAKELTQALGRIEHCLEQLTEEQVWWRYRPSLNSIGNLILHLAGNVNQWLVAGLRGSPSTRDRPSEFSERGPISKEKLLRTLKAAVNEATIVLASQKPGELLQRRNIQGFDVTGLGAIFNSVPHFRGHTQEIISMTRMQLGDAYKFAWQPSTEQGA